MRLKDAFFIFSSKEFVQTFLSLWRISEMLFKIKSCFQVKYHKQTG